MASSTHSQDVALPAEDEEAGQSVQDVQSHYLRCPSPSFSMMSESRFSAISGSDAASIFMEPIHLSSAVAAKKIINEELPPRSPRAESIPESLLESAEQLMVEDLYNRVRDMMDDRSPYNTPCVLDLQRALVQDRLEAPVNPVDEVWPNIFIAEKAVAVNKARLKRMGITHILNAAHGTGVYTGESFYTGMNITYLGIEVDDFPDVDISIHFRSTAEFLDEALLTHKGKVLVVSMMGSSRSAILVASYLMIFQHMSILEALTAIRKKRAINPNEGFLKQLRELNETLMEERDDDDDTLSQCSVIDARTRARIFGESVDDGDDTEREDDQSMISVKAQSIMLEEEEDAESVMSSMASSAAALLNRVEAKQNGTSSGDASGDLPLPEAMDPDEEDEGLDKMIRDWQRRNEVFQNEEWWEAQLNSDGEEESIDGQWTKKNSIDTESVTSEEVKALKSRLKQRCKRPPSDTMSTSSCMSYSDLWKQRLQEIEEEAARRYRSKDEEKSSGTEEAKSTIDDEVVSIMSDTTSMFNFCQKNKEKMTPLERWRVKRIHFGWNKKDREDGEKSSVADGEKGETEARVPNLEDVNLTAYQAWKRRQQKRYGEENTEEILEMSRGEDSAAAKRRQRREELLERSRKTLEESQSLCGWEEDSCVSGGTVPLSAFWAGAGVTGTPSVANDDNMSMLSGRSSIISSVSQPRSSRSTHSVAPTLPPILPVPTVQGPGGEPMVNLSSIQNWIANVVTETIKQKQSEMSLPPPSRASSEVSYAPAMPGRPTEDDRTSLLSGASYSSALNRGKTASVFSDSRASSALTGKGSVLTSGKSKITTTSVPLFSLFQDQVDLNKLDAIEKEIQSEMRGKMATYERKKILADNKRSTMYKKKKPKEEDEEEDEEAEKRKEEEFLKEVKKKPARSHGLSGCLNLNPALERDKNMNIDDWLRSVRPPPGKLEADQSEDLYDDLDASASMLDFSPHQDSDDEEFLTSARRPRLQGLRDEEYSRFVLSSRGVYGDREESYQDYSTKPVGSRHRNNEEEEEDDVAAFIAQTRQRVRARTAAEADDDEVLTAWRAQLESKSRGPDSQNK
ncbi:serine/threonine/tyrosine-interacting-like protein 2 [Synchiropus picturatus]